MLLIVFTFCSIASLNSSVLNVVLTILVAFLLLVLVVLFVVVPVEFELPFCPKSPPRPVLRKIELKRVSFAPPPPMMKFCSKVDWVFVASSCWGCGDKSPTLATR